MRILIIGCGSIGSILSEAINDMPEVDKFYITDVSSTYAQHLIDDLSKAEYLEQDSRDVYEIISKVDLVVEAASQEAAIKYAPLALENGVDVMVMSVGAFADDRFRDKCFNLAKKHHSRIYVPSGAISGTDGLHAAASSNLTEVHLTTRKGPDGLRNAPGLALRNIDVDSLVEATVVFDGSAREAVDQFPKNLNVAATISILGVGFEQTRVTIICDPSTERNSHTLAVKGEFGEMVSEIKNMPSPSNPATSYLAALSATAAIRRIVGNVWIGI
ncbi:MAG: aspartate dehydrogenase [Euryarchaeota archaeon]|nr:aspartate dehydrogenase [Euryarchaeota archaeon]